MRALIATLVAGMLAVSGASATAKPAPPKPDLRTSDVLPVLSGTSVATYATITNKGKKKAKASTAAFYLSTDTTQGAGDVLLGTAPVAKLKPKAKVIIYPTFAVSAPAGAYHVVVCADSDGKVKEKKEGNNCAASPDTITVGSTTPPPPPGSYNVTVTPYFAWVYVSINGDTPSSSGRTVSFPAGSQVVLTVTPVSGYTWSGDWTSPDATCNGTVADAGSHYSMTFSSLSHNVDCVPQAHL
jgi:hypothetical protein